MRVWMLASLAAVLPPLLFAQSREKRVAPVDAATRQSFERQPKVAVLAGIGNYPARSGLSALRYPARDVELMRAELERQGYKAVALKDQEATRGSIVQALKDAAELVDRGRGTVLFFFSGHGFQDQGANYLASFEATSANLAASGLAVKTVEDLLKATGAPRQVMFIDACRNEPGKSAGARSFDRFEAAAGLRVLFSTKAGRISYEDDQLGSGRFTHFLVRGLRGEAAGADGLVTFRDLADYVTEGVSTYGFQKGQMQVPYEAGESSGDFLLGKAASGGAATAPAGSPATCGNGCTARLSDLHLVTHYEYDDQQMSYFGAVEKVYRFPEGWPIGPYLHVVEYTFKLQDFPGRKPPGWDDMTPQQQKERTALYQRQMAQLAKNMTRLCVAATDRKQDSDWPLQYGGAAGSGTGRGTDGQYYQLKLFGEAEIESITLELRPFAGQPPANPLSNPLGN